MESNSAESVIVIHGFGGHWVVMHPLARNLRSSGYQVRNWGYASLWGTIDQHAERLRQVIEKLEKDAGVSRFHLVSHSMGSILVRVALGRYNPEKLGRIVMLAPPNKGSHAATTFSPWFGWFSKTLTEIADTPQSFVNSIETLIEPQYEIGIVRASNDFVVQRPATELEEAKEYVVAPGFHSSILLKKHSANLVDKFLRTGSFGLED